MNSLIVSGLGALSLLWPFGHAPQTTTKEFSLPVWRIATYKDRFTSQVRCRVYQGPLRRPLISYSSKAVAFHFKAPMNTTEAYFRLDSGPVKAWRTEYPKLVKLGVQLEGDSLENPTGGLVILPIEDLANIHTVTIRPTPKSTPRTFGIDGLTDAVANAVAHGCDPDAGFVR
jgi:hypothetical protein